MNLTSILVIGFLLGMKHATEADHLAAVATLATRESTLPQALRQGLAWGLGHTATLMLVGGVVLALGKALPPYMEALLETAVGVMLVALGVDVLRRLLLGREHVHGHSHGTDGFHIHMHSHVGPAPAAAPALSFSQLKFAPHAELPHRHEHPPRVPLRALAIGMMHGMAGSAALIVLSLQSVQSVTMGFLYITLFGIGSMVGMAILSVIIAVPLRLSAGSLTALHRIMSAAVGLFSIALGLWVIYRKCFA